MADKPTKKRQEAELYVARRITQWSGYKVVRSYSQGIDWTKYAHLIGRDRALPWWPMVYTNLSRPESALYTAERRFSVGYRKGEDPDGRTQHIVILHKSYRQPWRAAMRADVWADCATKPWSWLITSCYDDVILRAGRIVDLTLEDWLRSMRNGAADPTIEDWPAPRYKAPLRPGRPV